MKNRTRKLVEMYVWELPVRFYHWINALCIFILCVTGFIIANPPAIISGTEAAFVFWFGHVRFIHFVTAFVFLFNFMFRIYWGFVGNQFASWQNFIPYRKSQWMEIIEVIKVDILQVKSKPIESIGHNALAAIVYFGMFLAFLLQCLTGFGLYAQMSKAFLPKMFAWVIPLLGGDLTVRFIHHILMWFFIIFAIVHVYLVFYHDYIERRGVTSSIIGGWKFIEEEVAAGAENGILKRTEKQASSENPGIKACDRDKSGVYT